MEYKFKNRYNDEITFKKDGDSFQMIGGKWGRYLYNEGDDGYYAYDPSGGPFINVGMDMGDIHEELKGLEIIEILINEGKITLKTKQL